MTAAVPGWHPQSEPRWRARIEHWFEHWFERGIGKDDVLGQQRLPRRFVDFAHPGASHPTRDRPLIVTTLGAFVAVVFNLVSLVESRMADLVQWALWPFRRFIGPGGRFGRF